mmetsp:Transcript_13797/g.51678  ORF Transcript_13797/g.51678 Transcript_13797/m.51678 type:complete len:200 (+) Transcript_13797:1040-1639(+)
MSRSSWLKRRSAESKARLNRGRSDGTPNANVDLNSSNPSFCVRNVPDVTHCSANCARRSTQGSLRVTSQSGFVSLGETPPFSFPSALGNSNPLRVAGSLALTSAKASSLFLVSAPTLPLPQQGTTNASPISLCPARPALPAICRYDDGVTSCIPNRITTRRAGKLTPAASVVVHANTNNAPVLNPSSMASFSLARKCAW